MRVHIIIIIFVIFLVYFNSLFGTFVYDDYVVVVNNNFIKSWKNLALLFNEKYLAKPFTPDSLFDLNPYNFGSGETTYRPVATLTYFLNYSLFKMNAWGYRFTNVLIHTINAVLVYLVLNKLFSRPILSLFSGILFGIHPINSEVVNCSAFRPNSLAFLFSLLTIILYLKFRAKATRFSYIYLFISLFSAGLAVFSKEIAIILPIAIILCDYYIADFKLKRLFVARRYYLLYILVGIFYVFIYFTLMPPRQKIFMLPDQSIYISLIRTFDILSIYLKDMVFPNNLVFIPPMDIQSSHFRIASGLLVIFISIYIVARKRRYPKELSFAIIWFFLWLLPMNNFLNTFRILLAYRFVYIAMLGFSLLLGFFLERIWQVSTRFLSEALILRRTLVLFFLILLCMASFYTNFFWKNERLLYLAVTEKYPSLVSTRIALGRALFKYGNYKEALKQLNDILAHHQHRMGRYDLANTYYSLGLIYMTISEYPKSEQNYLEAIKLFPQKPQLYTELGICYAQQGLYKKALEQFSKAKALDPGYILAYLQSGVTYKLMREYPKAEREFKRALEMYPDSREALYYLENLRGTGGKE